MSLELFNFVSCLSYKLQCILFDLYMTEQNEVVCNYKLGKKKHGREKQNTYFVDLVTCR